MKTSIKKSVISFASGAALFLGFAGSISGSLAWWAYSTRATIIFQGTSVASSEQLQIGIKVAKNVVDLSHFGMYEISGISGYQFCDAGAGLPAEAIAYYLTQEGTYAVDKLKPITSSEYSIGEEVNLKSSLVAGTAFNNYDAETDHYVHIPFAFRVMRYDISNNRTYAKGENIWLSDAIVEASSSNPDSTVYKAIRIYSVGKKATKEGNTINYTDVKTVINPSDNSTSNGSTAVAGLLDISGDGYYDVFEQGLQKYAIIYGENNLTPAQQAAIYTEQQSTSVDSDLVDFNGTNFISEATTFTSKFYRGTHYPASLNAISPKYQIHDTLGTVKPHDNNGVLTLGKPLCSTSNDANAIADLDMTIWLEGWDHNVIDQENTHSFNLGLQFQISRL